MGRGHVCLWWWFAHDVIYVRPRRPTRIGEHPCSWRRNHHETANLPLTERNQKPSYLTCGFFIRCFGLDVYQATTFSHRVFSIYTRGSQVSLARSTYVVNQRDP